MPILGVSVRSPTLLICDNLCNDSRWWVVGMRRMTQAVLPLLPAEAVPIGPVAGVVEGPEGGVVFVCGMATFAFDAGDEVGRRLAAVQLVTTDIASAGPGAEGVGVWRGTPGGWRG